MEPLCLAADSRHRPALTELAFELTQKAAGFRRSRLPGLMAPLATLVRSMNCYYSNFIEGHNTHPVDIERALNGNYSEDSGKRNLQLEARAHIAVQGWIDEGAWAAAPRRPTGSERSIAGCANCCRRIYSSSRSRVRASPFA